MYQIFRVNVAASIQTYENFIISRVSAHAGQNSKLYYFKRPWVFTWDTTILRYTRVLQHVFDNNMIIITFILVIYFSKVCCRDGTGSLGREAWYLNICPGTYLSFHSWGRGGNWSFTSSSPTPTLSDLPGNWLGVTLLVGGMRTTFKNEFCIQFDNETDQV